MKKNLFLVVLFMGTPFLLFSPGLKAKECELSNEKFSCLSFVENYDGDTITVDIPGLPALFGKHIGVRLWGIDAPELKTKDPCEKDKAIEAKRLVHRLLSKGKIIEVLSPKRDKYFRIVGDVVVDQQVIRQILLDKKLAYPYFGDTKPSINWCQ